MSRLRAVATAGSLFLIPAATLAAQSRAEYQSVDTIRVDSLVRERPVSTLSELLSGRVAGVYASPNEPLPALRAPSPDNGSAQPLVFVDGAEYTPFWQDLLAASTAAGSGNPLDDLDPNDVEMIEILKGPAATALYGTGGGNGVIRITTKHGMSGRLRGTVHARRRTAEMSSVHELYAFHAWGHSIYDGSVVDGCTPEGMYNGTPCVRDSVTMEATAAMSRPTRSLGGWTYGGNVAGGSPALRYFLSANVNDDDNFTRLGPTADASAIGRLGLSRVNLRANLAHQLGARGELGIDAGYILGSGSGAAGPDVLPALLSATSDERVRRFTGSAHARLPLTSWLLASGTVGHDHGRRHQGTLDTYPILTTDTATVTGGDTTFQRTTTANLDLSAAGRWGRLTGRTSLGGEYTWRKASREGADSTVLTGGQLTSLSWHSYDADAKARGIYVDQMISLNERLVVTGGFRTEWLDLRGQHYDAKTYPRVSASWRPLDEPWMPHLPGAFGIRLRYAYGVAAGYVNPGPTASLILAGPSSTGPAWSGQPDRVAEHEFGIDVDGLAHRLQLKLTHYRRHTEDWRVVVPYLASVYSSLSVQLATETSQHGFEAGLGARIIETRWFSWNLSVQHASNATKVDSSAALAPYYSYSAGFVGGYPVGAVFRRYPIVGYVDANGDGILQPSEVQSGVDYEYLGTTTPRRTQALATTIGLFNRRLRVSGTLERRSGHVRPNLPETELCAEARCQAAVVTPTPLAEQAQVVAVQTSPGYFLVEPADFTRLRELSATFDLPSRFARAVRAQSLALTVGGRNLALWTGVTGADPETNDLMSLAKAWMLRLDVGL